MPRVTASRREPTPTGGGVSHRSSTADADQAGVFSASVRTANTSAIGRAMTIPACASVM